MTAIPGPGNTDDGIGHGMSGALITGLEVVIPPLVATALVSPLILLEALLGAFIDTGRDLVFPAIALLVVSLWLARDLRRRNLDVTGESN